MSVSGRAGAGGGGPHQGALPQTAEAIRLYRFGLGKKQTRGSLDRCSFAAEKSPLFFCLLEAERVPQTNTMGLQIKGRTFSLENEQINTSSVLALSHILVPAPMDRFA